MARKLEEPNIKVIKDNEYYYYVVELPRNSLGKRQRKYIYQLKETGQRDTKAIKLLQQKVNDFKQDIEQGYKIDDRSTFQGLFKSWLYNTHMTNLKPATKERYNSIYNNYVENTDLGKMKISYLNSIVLQEYYTGLSNAGKTASQIKNLHKLVKPFLLFIYNNGFVKKDYGAKGLIKLPTAIVKHEKDNLSVFSLEEQKQLIKALDNNKERLIFITALYTGLRLGEILGLKWNNVNLKESTIKVNETIKRVKNLETGKNEIIIQHPKTKNSIRTVPIPKALLEELKKHKKLQIKNILLLGQLYSDNKLVFCTDLGAYLDASNVNKRFKKLQTKAKIEPRKFHSLRHTYATRLFEQGVDIKTVSELLGHSSTEITSNIYTHLLESQKKKVIEKLDNIFNL